MWKNTIESLHWGFNWRIHETNNKVNASPNCQDARLVKLSRTKKAWKFPQIFQSPLGVRKTVKSSTSTVTVVAGSLHPDEKPLSAELHKYHGFGVDIALLQLGFNVADLDQLPLIANDLME